MSKAPRVEIEARFFVLTSLGQMKQAGQLATMAADQPRLCANLLARYPLERWYELGLITEEQMSAWIQQALLLLAAL